MYYICKFSGTWLIYDGNAHTSSVLPPPQVETIRQLFPAALKETAVLDAVMLAPIPASRLQQTPGAAYFICRFATTWSLYDGYTKTSKSLETASIQLLSQLFSAAFNDSLILDTLMISSIPASRLQALTSSVPAQTVKKQP
jgi:hypothetical protein